MPANTSHLCFVQPQSRNLRLWRYMDFTKFMSLLDSSKLFFCRSDLFRDPFEGSYTQANIALRPLDYEGLSPEAFSKMSEQRALLAQRAHECTYVSCWHANEYESAAMWDLYAKTDEAVAIETTYGALVDSLPDTVYAGIVQYIDYHSEWFPEGNTFYPFLHKRKSFEHEREVRAVIQDFPMEHDFLSSAKLGSPPGQEISVPLTSLISTVHVSPTAPAWFGALVSSVAERYELQSIVKKSDLYSSPVY